MKFTTIAIGALPLLQLAVAQPHRVRHAHQQKHVKKDVDVVYVVDTVYAQATEFPEVTVFVDQDGAPLSTVTGDIIDPTLTFWSTAYGVPPAPATSAPATSAQAPTTSSAAAAFVNTPAAVVNAPTVVFSSSVPLVAPVVNVESSSASPVSSSSSTSGSTESGGYGLSYSPYNADKSCKTQDQVHADFAKIGNGYSLVRTYGTDCNQTATVLTAAKAKKLKLFAGIFDINSLADEVALITAAAGGDWTSFDTISVGNELVNSGTASPTAVIAAIGTVRGLLKTAGYTGKVVTVDTLIAARTNPGLCDASDYCAVNCHPFFDGKVAAKGSGDFLTTQIPTLSAVLANKNQEIVITETGWPWQGQPNGAAVPSVENQADALSSIRSTFSSNPSGVILFTPFNDMWKSNTAAQFRTDQYWGFIGYSPSG